MFDITYCVFGGCPFKDCERHLSQLESVNRPGSNIVSLADFAPVCRRYLAYALEEVMSND